MYWLCYSLPPDDVMEVGQENELKGRRQNEHAAGTELRGNELRMDYNSAIICRNM